MNRNPKRHNNLTSEKLKREFLKVFKKDSGIRCSMKKIRQDLLINQQAHHIVPVQVLKALNINENAYENYNRESNCLIVPKMGAPIVHNGAHPQYNAFVLLYIEDSFALFEESESKYSEKEIILAAADIIRDAFNDAMSIESRNYYFGDQLSLSMDDFARRYLWAYYYPDADIRANVEYLKCNSQNK